MRDLLGNEIEQPPAKTDEVLYQEYISSALWKRRAKAAKDRAGGKCQRCDVSKWSVELEAHHKTYERLGRERAEDIEVLCPECHGKADTERKARTERRAGERRYNARLDGWATKVYGENWYESEDTEEVRDAFDRWLNRQ